MSPKIVAAMDLPEEHSGPYAVLEIANQMLVRSLLSGVTLDSAIRYIVNPSGVRPNLRIIMESDARAYMNAANANYRQWWEGDTWVGPENVKDVSDYPYLHPRLITEK